MCVRIGEPTCGRRTSGATKARSASCTSQTSCSAPRSRDIAVSRHTLSTTDCGRGGACVMGREPTRACIMGGGRGSLCAPRKRAAGARGAAAGERAARDRMDGGGSERCKRRETRALQGKREGGCWSRAAIRTEGVAEEPRRGVDPGASATRRRRCRRTWDSSASKGGGRRQGEDIWIVARCDRQH